MTDMHKLLLNNLKSVGGNVTLTILSMKYLFESIIIVITRDKGYDGSIKFHNMHEHTKYLLAWRLEDSYSML